MLFALTALVLVTATAFAFAPRAELITEVHIPAPPDAVWAVLADGGSYRQWNPFIVSMHGALVPGARLTNVMQPAGKSPMTFSPTVLVALPAQELRWLGRFLVPRLFDGEHRFELVATAEGTRVIHAERFVGVALWFMSVETFRADFEAMNRALRARVLASDGGSPQRT